MSLSFVSVYRVRFPITKEPRTNSWIHQILYLLRLLSSRICPIPNIKRVTGRVYSQADLSDVINGAKEIGGDRTNFEGGLRRIQKPRMMDTEGWKEITG